MQDCVCTCVACVRACPRACKFILLDQSMFSPLQVRTEYSSCGIQLVLAGTASKLR